MISGVFSIYLFHGWFWSVGMPDAVHPGAMPRFSMRCLRLSWHRLHSDCKLFRSQNSRSLPLCALMWSTTFAGVVLPTSRQNTQSGDSLSTLRRSFRHLVVLYRGWLLMVASNIHQRVFLSAIPRYHRRIIGFQLAFRLGHSRLYKQSM